MSAINFIDKIKYEEKIQELEAEIARLKNILEEERQEHRDIYRRMKEECDIKNSTIYNTSNYMTLKMQYSNEDFDDTHILQEIPEINI